MVAYQGGLHGHLVNMHEVAGARWGFFRSWGDDVFSMKNSEILSILGGGNSNIFHFHPYLGK